MVLVVYKSVVEHPKAFVYPQSKKTWFCVVVILVAPEEPLENFGNISQVEHVVDFGGCGQHPLYYVCVQIN